MKKEKGYILKRIADEYNIFPCGEKAEETAGTVAASAGKRYQYGLFPGEYAGQPCQPG